MSSIHNCSVTIMHSQQSQLKSIIKVTNVGWKVACGVIYLSWGIPGHALTQFHLLIQWWRGAWIEGLGLGYRNFPAMRMNLIWGLAIHGEHPRMLDPFRPLTSLFCWRYQTYSQVTGEETLVSLRSCRLTNMFLFP